MVIIFLLFCNICIELNKMKSMNIFILTFIYSFYLVHFDLELHNCNQVNILQILEYVTRNHFTSPNLKEGWCFPEGREIACLNPLFYCFLNIFLFKGWIRFL